MIVGIIVLVLGFIVMVATGIPFFGATAIVFVGWFVIIIIAKLIGIFRADPVTQGAAQSDSEAIKTRELREWSSTKDGHKFKGKYWGRDATHVFVRRDDEKIVKMPCANLVEADRSYLTELTSPAKPPTGLNTTE